MSDHDTKFQKLIPGELSSLSEEELESILKEYPHMEQIRFLLALRFSKASVYERFQKISGYAGTPEERRAWYNRIARQVQDADEAERDLENARDPEEVIESAALEGVKNEDVGEAEIKPDSHAAKEEILFQTEDDIHPIEEDISEVKSEKIHLDSTTHRSSESTEVSGAELIVKDDQSQLSKKKKKRKKKRIQILLQGVSPISSFSNWLLSLASESMTAEELKPLKKKKRKRKKKKKSKLKEKAKRSIRQNEDIVSETLAQLYTEQGHYNKAVKMYEKLSLIFPEKSTYFAGLIEKLKK